MVLAAELDADGVGDLFTMAPNTAPGTAILRGIEEVQPGNLVVHRAAGTRSRAYWELATRPHVDDEATTIARVRSLLEDAVSSQNVSLLLLFERVRRDATVALSGESADEWFGGYAWYHDPIDLDREGFPWARAYAPLAHLMRADLRETVQPDKHIESRYHQALDTVPYLDGESAHDRKVRRALWLTKQHYLRFLLMRKDRLSMATAVEARVPFCDHRLIEYVWNIPWDLKNIGGMEKGVLRKAGEDLLPDAVAWRKKSGYPAASLSSLSVL